MCTTWWSGDYCRSSMQSSRGSQVRSRVGTLFASFSSFFYFYLILFFRRTRLFTVCNPFQNLDRMQKKKKEPSVVVNGKCETLREGETSAFLFEPDTYWLFKLRDRDFKVFKMRARDVQTLRRSDVIYWPNKQIGASRLSKSLAKSETPTRT
jgi:hypothetical protein